MILDVDELSNRQDGLKRLLVGYRALLSSPDSTPEMKAELQEGIIKNERELSLVNAVLDATFSLLNNGYPDHIKEDASPAIVSALKKLSEDVALVPKDFNETVVLADTVTVVIKDK